MEVSLRSVASFWGTVSLSAVQGQGGSLLCLQGKAQDARRLKGMCKAAARFAGVGEEALLLPFDPRLKGPVPTLLFPYVRLGPLTLFLRHVSPYMQYVTGRRLGFILHHLHTAPLADKDRSCVRELEVRNLKKLSAYLNGPYRFRDDAQTLEALMARFTSFKLSPHAAVLRLGALTLDSIFVTDSHELKLLPLPSFRAGDRAEDLALLCAEGTLSFPALCAGIVDGYFGQVPTSFWLNFAMYSALTALTRYARTVISYGLKSPEGQEALFKSRAVRAAFADFKEPLPAWYLSPESLAFRQRFLREGH